MLDIIISGGIVIVTTNNKEVGDVEYRLNTKTGEVTHPSGRFYCFVPAWDISPAKKEGAKLMALAQGIEGEVFAIHPTMYLIKYESMEGDQLWERTVIIDRW